MTATRIRAASSALFALVLFATGCSNGGSGNGTLPPPPVSAPAVTISASSLTFTGTDSEYPTAPQVLTLTNSGNASLTLNSETLQGADANFFSGIDGGVSGCADLTLAPGASCTTNVVFTPNVARSYSATLTFTDNAVNSPQSVSLSGTLGAPSTPVAKAQFGYAINFNGVISSFTISSTGVWTPTSPATVSFGDNTGAMVIDPLGKFIFVAGFNSGDVGSFSIAPSTGALVAAGTALASNTNNRPEAMTVDPTGTFIYTSNTGEGTVSEYTVNRSNGALTLGATVTLPVASGIAPGDARPVGLVTDPTGKFLYVSDAGYVAAFAIDPATGALTPLSVPNAQGSPCITLRLGPTGKFLYCAGGNQVDIYAIDASTGALTPLTVTGIGIPAGKGASDIGITFDSKYAYVTNQSDNTISLYTDNSSTGIIAPMTLSTFTQVGAPFAIAVDTGNQLAYVALTDGGINIMRLNPDGTISNYGQAAVSGGAVDVEIYPNHP